MKSLKCCCLGRLFLNHFKLRSKMKIEKISLKNIKSFRDEVNIDFNDQFNLSRVLLTLADKIC